MSDFRDLAKYIGVLPEGRQTPNGVSPPIKSSCGKRDARVDPDWDSQARDFDAPLLGNQIEI
jgi:hypothetical protein